MNTMGRRRGGRYADRPENVEITHVGSATYFRYVMPDGTRRTIGNSRDVQKAYDIARAMNGHFAQQRHAIDLTKLVDSKPKASASNPSVPKLIEEFRQHFLPDRRYAERTRAEIEYKLNGYAARWKNETVRDLTTLVIAQFLNSLTNNAYVKHRALLGDLLQFAGHQGYIQANPVTVTLRKRESDKVRERHTWEGVKAILDAPTTPDWLSRAIRIGLYSLQRAEDVVMLHKVRNKVDVKARTLEVMQRKTRNYKVPVYIQIEMGDELFEAVNDCLQSKVLCPLLIHRKPDRQARREQMSKEHPFAVTRSFLSRAFTEARDLAHAYDRLPPEKRPTFHELRSLGVHLYEQAGYDDAYIMALSGHAKMETLERYKRDHVAAAPKRVQAGLTAKQLPE